MAHELDFSNNRTNMAFLGEVPWHGLGQSLTPGLSLDDWIREAGFEWEAMMSPVSYTIPNGTQEVYSGRKVVYRSDTLEPLSVVSDSYKLVQPKEVMEFFRDVTEANKLHMETAGMLKGGALYWALARIDDEFSVTPDDPILPYVLLSTSCDGSLASTASFTSVRVVCANTLAMAVNSRKNNTQIKVPHNSVFDHKKIKEEMGLVGESWEGFKQVSTRLAQRTVSREEVVSFMMNVFLPDTKIEELGKSEVEEYLRKLPKIEKMVKLYEEGRGQDTVSAHGTAWGLVNAVSRQQDHEVMAVSDESRLRSAWFGAGKRTKAKALQLAMALAD
jgi:phage/plasmid-like protein (TIGR03299 family)